MRIGRHAGNGQFTTVAKARRNKRTHIVQNIKRGGRRHRRR